MTNSFVVRESADRTRRRIFLNSSRYPSISTKLIQKKLMMTLRERMYAQRAKNTNMMPASSIRTLNFSTATISR